MSVEANKALIRRFLEEVSHGGNLELMDQLCASDMVNHSAPASGNVGVDAFRAITQFSRSAQPDQHITHELMIAEGDLVMVHGLREATWNLEKYRGWPTTKGQHVSVELVRIFRIRDGRIAEHWELMDALGLMRQLGIAPAPPG